MLWLEIVGVIIIFIINPRHGLCMADVKCEWLLTQFTCKQILNFCSINNALYISLKLWHAYVRDVHFQGGACPGDVSDGKCPLQFSLT